VGKRGGNKNWTIVKRINKRLIKQVRQGAAVNLAEGTEIKNRQQSVSPGCAGAVPSGGERIKNSPVGRKGDVSPGHFYGPR